MKKFLAQLSDINSRVIVMVLAVLILNFILVFKVFEAALVGGAINNITNLNSSKLRGQITDRNNNVVATNLPTASLYVNPNMIEDKAEAINALVKLFPEINQNKLTAKLNSKSHFKWVARHISPKKQQKINELGIIGLNLIQDNKRIYPSKHNLAHIIGNVDWDNNGVSGIEKQYDKLLNNTAALNNSLQLTIDSNVQEVVRATLNEHINKHNALGGAAIVMDPHTGEVLSMVSLPDYDPNFVNIANDDQMFNRATKGLYEPGSTMKAISVAMALDSNAINLNGVFNVSQPIRYGKFSISDFRMRKGDLSVPEILMYSSNIGVVQIAHKLERQTQKRYFKNFGLLDNLDLKLTEKSYPLFPQGNKWGEIAASTISFGHGIAVSPLHMISAYAPLVNGGYAIKPKLVTQYDENKPKQIISNDTSVKMRKLLRAVVKKGAGQRAEKLSKGYILGGKTGSAEKTLNGKYLKNANIASFCGAFPIHKPKYLVYVMIDEAKKNKQNGGTTGGRIAAPLAGELVANIAPMLGVAPQRDIKSVELELSLNELQDF